MTWRWTSACAVLLAIGSSAAAQQARELGVQATVLASSPAVAVAGLYGALRTTARTRLAVTAGVGATDGRFAWRSELLAHFLLNPRSTTRPGIYGGGGVAATGAGGQAKGYVVVLLGIEARPGGSSGWAVEAGLGGGLRAAVGWRWRRR